MNTKRVVITGMGIVSSIGNNIDEVKNFDYIFITCRQYLKFESIF